MANWLYSGWRRESTSAAKLAMLALHIEEVEERLDVELSADSHSRSSQVLQARLERLAAGNPGDVKSVGQGVSELRIDYGPGYRVYFTKKGRTVIVLLAGGDKGTQTADIKTAQRLARNL